MVTIAEAWTHRSALGESMYTNGPSAPFFGAAEQSSVTSHHGRSEAEDVHEQPMLPERVNKRMQWSALTSW